MSILRGTCVTTGVGVTVETERPVQVVEDQQPRRKTHRLAVSLAGLAIVSVGAAAAVVAFHSGHAKPNPVLGHSLQTLAVYRVELPSSARPGQVASRVVSDLGRPGHTTRIDKSPTFSLHVQYAHVRQVAGRWQLMLVAPEGAAFNVDTTQGQFYDVLVHGEAVSLFFVAGTQGPGPDHGTNFAFGAGPNSMTRADAVALANALTTSVLVD